MASKRDEPEAVIAPRGPIDAVVTPPPSKSLTIRALAAAALARGVSLIESPLDSADVAAMREALRTLGIVVEQDAAGMRVEGCAGRPPASGARLDLGDAGTPLRLLTAICCLGRGLFVLDGSRRMRQRPVGDLVGALARLGVRVRTVLGNGCPPVVIDATGLAGGVARLRGDVSSQFVSALLMAGPCAAGGLRVEVEGPLVSRPYVDLTLQIMEAFGARPTREGSSRFLAPGDGYTAARYTVEADASSAAYWLGAAAISGGRVKVTGIPPGSRQGDLGFLALLGRMGCTVSHDSAVIVVNGGELAGIEADLRDAPDLAPTLAAVALFARGATRIRGVSHLRLKESDRIDGIAACAAALGATVRTEPDGLTVLPPGGGRFALHGAVIDPRGDHRLAMAFALPGLAVAGVRVLDPGCVAKSYPGFFERLASL